MLLPNLGSESIVTKQTKKDIVGFWPTINYSGPNDLDLHFNISYYHLSKEQINLWKQNIKP